MWLLECWSSASGSTQVVTPLTPPRILRACTPHGRDVWVEQVWVGQRVSVHETWSLAGRGSREGLRAGLGSYRALPCPPALLIGRRLLPGLLAFHLSPCHLLRVAFPTPLFEVTPICIQSTDYPVLSPLKQLFFWNYLFCLLSYYLFSLFFWSLWHQRPFLISSPLCLYYLAQCLDVTGEHSMYEWLGT